MKNIFQRSISSFILALLLAFAFPSAISADDEVLVVEYGQNNMCSVSLNALKFDLSVSSVTPSEATDLTYQWYQNGVNYIGTATAIPGATKSVYRVPTNKVGTMYYYCLVTGKLNGKAINSLDSTAMQIIRVDVGLPTAPIITKDIQSVTVTEGDSAFFDLRATGITEAHTFIWWVQRPGESEAVPYLLYSVPEGALGGTYSTDPLDVSMNGAKVYCTVSMATEDFYGGARSATAVITVLEKNGMIGDINGNGKIDAPDYLLLRRYLMGSVTFTAEQEYRADVNYDGTQNAKDYILIRQQVLGKDVIH